MTSPPVTIDGIAQDLQDRWSPWFRPLSNFYWVCLNGDRVESCTLDGSSPPNFHRLESGEYAERDWALHARWYVSSKPWEGFIPQPCQEVLSGPHRWAWLGRAEPAHWTEASGTMVRLRPQHVKDVERTCEITEQLLSQVRGLYDHKGIAAPSLADRSWLRSEFALPQLLAPRLWDLRRNVVNVLGFLSWALLLDKTGWQTQPWDPTFVDTVLDMRVLECPKRGVHVKTEGIDMTLLRVWIEHRVPVHYMWDPRATGIWCPVAIGARNCHSYNHLTGEAAPPPKNKAKKFVWNAHTMRVGEAPLPVQTKAAQKTYWISSDGTTVREVTSKRKAKSLAGEYNSKIYKHASGDIRVLCSSYEPEDGESGLGKPVTSAILSRWASQATLRGNDLSLGGGDDDSFYDDIPGTMGAPSPPPAPSAPTLREESNRVTAQFSLGENDSMGADPCHETTGWTAAPTEEESDYMQGIESPEDVPRTEEGDGSSEEVPPSAVPSDVSTSASPAPPHASERKSKQVDNSASLPRDRRKRIRESEDWSSSRRPRYHDVWRPESCETGRRSLSPPRYRMPESRLNRESERSRARQRSSSPPPRELPSRRSPVRLYYDGWSPLHRRELSPAPIRKDPPVSAKMPLVERLLSKCTVFTSTGPVQSTSSGLPVAAEHGSEGVRPPLVERLLTERASLAGESSASSQPALLDRLQNKPEQGGDVGVWIRSRFAASDSFLLASSGLPRGLIPDTVAGSILKSGRLELPPVTAIRCHALLAESPELRPEDLPALCLARGMAYRIWVPLGKLSSLVPKGMSLTRGKPAYLNSTDVIMTARDASEACAEYLQRVTSLLMRPHARRFLTLGGLLWRIALEFGPPGLYQAALAGPSTDVTVYNAGEYLATAGETDDVVSDDEIEILLGALDGPLWRQRLYLWPFPAFVTDSGRWTGEWTEQNESWFTTRLALIRSRSPSAFLSRKAWRSAVKPLSAATLANEGTVNTVAHAIAALRDGSSLLDARLELPPIQ
ncbi:hypothetical protein BJ138DRAFT_1103346 [Hygrophoropsis aurantiaca]|uniref:Uncharacterized protein n=1 Tax=Hygrophoropsis aurantiaca TaxID=72124 RepID=A0ACB8A593_9AGAM|nr:hypothetical protein BJ138DRAFT_1103346 [Hygrophoropsis aurantiaca]